MASIRIKNKKTISDIYIGNTGSTRNLQVDIEIHMGNTQAYSVTSIQGLTRKDVIKIRDELNKLLDQDNLKILLDKNKKRKVVNNKGKTKGVKPS